MCMAAGGIKGLIYLEACACFSVHSGIPLSLREDGCRPSTVVLATVLANEIFLLQTTFECLFSHYSILYR